MTETWSDKLLDRAVVPGYSALGYQIRKRGWSPADPAPDALLGRRALVTGAGGGLGEATALGLARLGATVHLLGRSAARLAPALDRLTRALEDEGRPVRLEVEECDVSDLDAVRRFGADLVARFSAQGASLDVLVHNAGVLPEERTVSSQGHELTVATHVLGPVLMTELVLPVLADGARVVLVSSGGMYTQPLPVDDPEYTRGSYRGAVAYARSKRMQVELAPVLDRRWRSAGVAVHAMHPGWADTPGVASSLPLFRLATKPVLRTPEAGADTVVWLAATEPAPAGGQFWHDRVVRPRSYRAATEPGDVEVARLWSWIRDQVGLHD